MSLATDRRTIAMCADDFGISPAIDDAVMSLAERGRVQAISCLVGADEWPEKAKRLKDAPAELSIGLHILLTRVARTVEDKEASGDSPEESEGRLLLRSLCGRIDGDAVGERIDRQLDRFETATGRRPDHVDGHHHVHAMPGIAEVLCETLARRYGRDLPWLRVLSPCLPSPTARVRRRVIAYLGNRQRRLLAQVPIEANAAFGGVRNLTETDSYGTFLENQLKAVAVDNTLIMCHPGLPGGKLAGHPFAASRAREYEFIAGPGFPFLLLRLNRQLSPISPQRIAGPSAFPGGSAVFLRPD